MGEDGFDYYPDTTSNQLVLYNGTALDALITPEAFDRRKIIQLPEHLPGNLGILVVHDDWSQSEISLPNVFTPDHSKLRLDAIIGSFHSSSSRNPFRDFPDEIHPYQVSFRLLPPKIPHFPPLRDDEGQPMKRYDTRHPDLLELIHHLAEPNKGGFWQLTDIFEQSKARGLKICSPFFTVGFASPPTHFVF